MIFALIRLLAVACAAYAGVAHWPPLPTIAALSVVIAAAGVGYGLALAARSTRHLRDITGSSRPLAMPPHWPALMLRDLAIGAAATGVALLAGRFFGSFV